MKAKIVKMESIVLGESVSRTVAEFLVSTNIFFCQNQKRLLQGVETMLPAHKTSLM